MGLAKSPEDPLLKAAYEAAKTAKESAAAENAGDIEPPTAALEEAGDIFVGAKPPVPDNQIERSDDDSAEPPVPDNQIERNDDDTAEPNVPDNQIERSDDDTAEPNVPDNQTAQSDDDTAEPNVQGNQIEQSVDDSAETPPLAIPKIKGLLRYIQELSAFIPPEEAQNFNEKDISGIIAGIVTGLEKIESGEYNGDDTVAKSKITEDSSMGPDVAESVFSRITGILNYLEKLAALLPESEERDGITKKVDSIIKELRL
jgi:hypothetical protein